MENWIKNVDKMKHLYLIGNQSKAAQYGIGTYFHQVIDCLKDISNIRLTIVILNADIDAVEEKKCDTRTIRYLYFSINDVVKNKTVEQRTFRNIAYSLGQYFSSEEQNIIHLNFLHHAPLVNWLKKIDISFRLVVTIHYFEWSFYLKGNISQLNSILKKPENIKSKMELWLSMNYERDVALFNQSDSIVCLSEHTHNILRTSYCVAQTKITLIYNGLKDEVVSLNEKECELMKYSLGFQKTDKIILFVGRLDSNKGLKLLIKSFRAVLLTIPDSKLVIVGDGQFDEFIKECTDIWSKVIFTGRLTKDKLYNLYQITNAGALPSFDEQCSYVGIEMLMHGIPWIGTNTSGLKEMAEGLYCLPLKYEGGELTISTELLSQWLIEIITQPRSKEFRLRYEKYYTISSMKIKLLSMYSKLKFD